MQVFRTYYQRVPRIFQGFFSINPYKESRRLSYRKSIFQSVFGYLVLALISSIAVFVVIRFDQKLFDTLQELGVPVVESERVFFPDADPEIVYEYTDPFQLLELSVVQGELYRRSDDRTILVLPESFQHNGQQFENSMFDPEGSLYLVLPMIAMLWAFFAIITLMIGRLLFLGFLALVFGSFVPTKGTQKRGADMFGLFSHASFTADTVVLLAILVYGAQTISRIPLFSLVLFIIWGLVTYSSFIESRRGKIV